MTSSDPDVPHSHDTPSPHAAPSLSGVPSDSATRRHQRTSPRVDDAARLESASQGEHRIPRAFWVAAGFWSLVTLLLSFPPPGSNLMIADIGNMQPESVWTQLTGLDAKSWTYTLMSAVVGVAAAGAPLLALRFPRIAVVPAFLPSIPLVLFMFSPGVPLRLSTFTALLGVATAAMSRNILRGWLLGCVALVVPGLFAFYSGTRLWTVGTTGVVASQYWGPGYRLTSFLMYTFGASLALGTSTVLALSSRRAAEQRELTRRTAAVDARAEMARDLHDVVAHRMSLVAVRAETAPYSHPDMSDDTRAVLADIATDARAALAEMRDVLGVLRDDPDTGHAPVEAPLRPQPDATDLTALVDEARSAGSDITVVGTLPTTDPLTGNTLYRVVQEALTNARRHSSPHAPITLTFTEAPDSVRVVVSNPSSGRGLEPGRGLTGMRERVERSGGTLHLGHGEKLPGPDTTGSFVVDATLPRRSS